MSQTYNAQTTGNELVQAFSSEIRGKIIVVTGVAPNGLGAGFAEAVARGGPALLVLTARSPAKAEKTAQVINKATGVRTKVLHLDLGSLASVRKAADDLNSSNDVPHIDLLVNNAGIMAVDFKMSPDGVESQFATNHLGHFLFTNLLIEKLIASKSPRVVNVSSDGHRLGPIRWDDYNFKHGETYNKWRAYGQSKTANILFSLSLARKLADREAVDREMGNKEGWEDFKVKSAEQGIATHIYAGFSPDIKKQNGSYLENSQVANPWIETVKPWATSEIEAERLWKLSEELAGQKFNY